MDPYSEQQETPARPRSGCLWGCLGALIAASVVVVAVFGYGAWYFYKGFSSDSRIQAVVQAVRADSQAAAVLGNNIKVLEVELHTYDYATGRGGTASYILKVAGSRGSGELKADLDITGHDSKIKLMVLTDSEGRTYYLVGNPPPNPMMQNSI